MAVSAEAEDWEVSEEVLVGVAAMAVVALADQEEVLDMAEMAVLEAVTQEGAVTEVALEVGWADHKVGDMEAEPAGTAVVSVDAQGD